MTKIIVTGGDGFIGTNLIPKLKNAGYEAVSFDRGDGDITEETTWQELPAYDVVIHLAAKSFVPDSWNNSYEFIKCNLLGTVGALNYCKKHQARLIFLSSYLYGNPEELPIKETAPLRPTNPYALSKKLGEEACAFYAQSHGLDITIFRPFNVYGSGQPENFLIQSVISQVKKSTVIQVKDLQPKRDYIYIDDVTDAIVKAVQVKNSFNIFNLGSGISYSVDEIIRMIQDIFCSNLPVISEDQRRKDEIMNTVADIDKAKQILNWSPSVDMKNGLRKIIEDSNL